MWLYDLFFKKKKKEEPKFENGFYVTKRSKNIEKKSRPEPWPEPPEVETRSAELQLPVQIKSPEEDYNDANYGCRRPQWERTVNKRS